MKSVPCFCVTNEYGDLLGDGDHFATFMTLEAAQQFKDKFMDTSTLRMVPGVVVMTTKES